MSCSQCQGIEELFSSKFVEKELAHYLSHGPDKTTLLLTDAIKDEGVAGLTLLDIGGGLGAVQHELFSAGVRAATSVEASEAYLSAARAEARRRGQAERVTYRYGNFIDLAGEISSADIVTLDRVICCYPDMEKLVGLSSVLADKYYGLVYPRDTWWVKLGFALENFYYWLRRSQYRAFVHPTSAVEAILFKNGMRRMAYRRTGFWQVAVFTRGSAVA